MLPSTSALGVARSRGRNSSLQADGAQAGVQYAVCVRYRLYGCVCIYRILSRL
jgi:hypothetical protein